MNERRLCDIAQKHMKQEYEFWQNLLVAFAIVGAFLSAGALSKTTLIIGLSMIVVGVIGCNIFEHKLDKLKKDPPEDMERLRKKAEQLEESPGQPAYIQKEYSFYTYLADAGCSMEELIRLIEQQNKPKQKLDELYEKYCQTAEDYRHQTKDQVTTMIMRARRRM